MANKNENIVKLADRLAPNQSKFELILAGVAAIALVLKMQHMASMSALLILSLSALALLFFFSSYASPSDETTRMEFFVSKLFAYGSAVVTFGILFILQDWKRSPTLLFAGCGVLLIGIVVKLMKSEVKISITKPALILIIALGLYFTPKEKLKEMNILQDHAVVSSGSTTGG